MTRGCISLAITACVVAGMSAAPVYASGTHEKTYAGVQHAFLQEQFGQVVRLVTPTLERAATSPSDVRMRLWLCLSLEYLQQVNDALRQIDRLKRDLASWKPGDHAGASEGLDGFWPEVLFWEGEISRRASQLIRARMAYERLLHQFPESSWRPQAMLHLGLVLFRQGSYEEAQRQFRDVARDLPSSALQRQAVLLQGLCEIQRKQFASAATRLRRLLEQSLKTTLRAKATFYLGEALTGLGQFHEAVQRYEDVLKTDADSPWAHVAHFGLGWSYFQQSRCAESLEAFATYIEQAPGIGQVGRLQRMDTLEVPAMPHETLEAERLFAQGHCHMALGDTPAALARFEALRALRPEHPLASEAALGVATLFERQQRYDDAISVLHELVAQSPHPLTRQQARLQLGSMYLALGKTQLAIAVFSAVKESEEVGFRQAGLSGLGDVQQYLGDYPTAAKWYGRAVGLAPTSRGGLYASYQLGRAQLRAGQFEEAIRSFQQVLTRAESGIASMGPSGESARRSEEETGRGRGKLAGRTEERTNGVARDARLALAFAYLSNAQAEPARQQLERVREQDAGSPQAARAAYYLALLALEDRQGDRVLELCEEVIQRVPRSDEALEARLLLTDLLASRTSPHEALEALSKMVGSFPRLPRAHRGKLAMKLGDLARRSSEYSRAIRWYEVAWHELPVHRGEVEYRLASCYEEGGDVPVAIDRYQTIRMAPWDVRGTLAAAKLMERERRWQAAMDLYASVTDQAVPEAKIAKERLIALYDEYGMRAP